MTARGTPATACWPGHHPASLTGNMSSHKGLNGTCSVHEYTGTFAGQPVHFKMTSVCGHVMTLDFLGEPPLLLTLHGTEPGRFVLRPTD